ncbi:hypothetical protein Pmar_PMAR001866 [Perkinsus marinus ATCC 50983]|uniref:RING-type domain-containing protein n=1 Tax=Perkinsus marinus (strain ATCC 50983 / TXsc) TaxID=423536 RepID=C5LFX7_PERM5|nr:hypothetical protein Pmar_PMAR001866 [Perkinsus marinus ATCC 50983]EER04358.1 hypothetical protein Pmar_PMAR001866 [Perkinsus marinus ATCC 50983]|eukprot:XP_002772542.1 hypothetical protein Pmar_PMAR001866 [Perkinsus marinus ATCC 50983]
MRYCTPIVNWLDLVKRLAWVIGVSLLLVAWMTAEALGLSPWLQYTLLALFIFLVAVPVLFAAWTVLRSLHFSVVLTANECSKVADIIYKKSTKEVFAPYVDDCAVCLERWEKGETLAELPCGHMYHRSCVRACISGSIPLLSKHSDSLTEVVKSVCCPLCRRPMVDNAERIVRAIKGRKTLVA